jgi:hypothetical protein
MKQKNLANKVKIFGLEKKRKVTELFMVTFFTVLQINYFMVKMYYSIKYLLLHYNM